MATEAAVPFVGSPISSSQQYRDRYRPTQPDMVDGDYGSTALAVANSANTAVTIQNGGALVQAGRYDLSAGPLTLPVTANGAGSNRFDIVCLTYDSTHSPVIYARIVQGTAGSGLPALTNNPTGVWDFPIAHFEKQTGTNAIINLRDRRKFSDGMGETLAADDSSGTNGAAWFPPAPRVGQLQKLWPSGDIYVWDGASWGVWDATFRKTANQNINNSAALVNLTDLAAPLSANGIYSFEGFFRYNSPTNVPDIKLGYTVPALASILWVPNGLDTAATTRVDNIDLREGDTSGSFYSSGTVGGSSGTIVSPKGIVLMGATAGNLQVQFAQSVATAETTVFSLNSWLRVRKIG